MATTNFVNAVTLTDAAWFNDVDEFVYGTAVSLTAFAGVTTKLTLGGTGASAVVALPGTLDASSSTVGAVTIAGGLAVAKKLYVGTDITASGTLTETTGAAWTDYTPNLTADTGTWGALTTTVAKYRLLGKTLFLRLQVTASVSSGSPTQFRLSLPGGATTAAGQTSVPANITQNGTFETGYLIVPSSAAYIFFNRAASGAYTGAVFSNINIVIELT